MTTTLDTAVTPEAVEELRLRCRGALVLPGEPAYDEATLVWNGMVDRARPSSSAPPAPPTWSRPSASRAIMACRWRFAAAATTSAAPRSPTVD